MVQVSKIDNRETSNQKPISNGGRKHRYREGDGSSLLILLLECPLLLPLVPSVSALGRAVVYCAALASANRFRSAGKNPLLAELSQNSFTDLIFRSFGSPVVEAVNRSTYMYSCSYSVPVTDVPFADAWSLSECKF